jgi:predicted unusual protein kinase regulating ubiquinone biosynthesis (AarF/ABC1/UbiB family)
MMQEELGSNAPWIEGEPVAAASLGQVYKISLKNREYAVKIQRPGLAEELVYDIVILIKIANVISKVYAWCCTSSDLVSVVKSWSLTLWQELDYHREARSMEFMYNTLVGRVSGLVIPQVYWPLSSLRVLTTEWINGARITSDFGALHARHITIGVEAFATMVLDIGMVHADPHAGNVLITIPGNEVCLLDFGMVVEVPPSHRIAWAKCLYCLIRGDHDATLDHLMSLGFFPPNCPRERILAVMPPIWTELVACGSNIDRRKKAIQTCSREILTFVREFEFALPDYYLALGRAMITLEGIAIAADMEFDIFKAALPMVMRFLAKQGKKETARLGRSLTTTMSTGAGTCCRRLKSANKVSPNLALPGALLLTMVGAGLGAVAVAHSAK